MKYFYFNNCVNWAKRDVFCEQGLSDMIENSIDITRRTFRKHVDLESLADIEESFGCYARHPKQGLTFAADWAISYHRSKLHGKTVYYFQHSSIEYVFTEDGKP